MAENLVVQAGSWLQDVVRVELRGELTAETCPVLESEFRRWIGEGITRFVIRLSDLAALSNVGVGALVSMIRTCQERGGTVTLERPSLEARKSLELTGVYPLLHVVHSTRDAIEQVQALAESTS